MDVGIIKVARFDVCLINLDPTLGAEIQKTRPCLVISPDSMNISRLETILIAPMTTTIRDHFPTRVPVEFDGKKGQVALDQLRVVDRTRLVKVLGKLNKKETKVSILRILQVMFSE